MCFLVGKTSIILTLLYRKQWLRGSLLTFNAIVQTNNAERSGRPNSAVVQENTQKLHKLVLANREFKFHGIAEELKISEGNAFTILHENLSR